MHFRYAIFNSGQLDFEEWPLLDALWQRNDMSLPNSQRVTAQRVLRQMILYQQHRPFHH